MRIKQKHRCIIFLTYNVSSIPLSISKCKPKLLTHRYLSKHLSCIDILHVARSFCEYYENQFVNVNNAYWQTIQRFHFGISLQGDIINPSHRCYLPTVNIPFCQSFITFRFKGFKSFITFGQLLIYIPSWQCSSEIVY